MKLLIRLRHKVENAITDVQKTLVEGMVETAIGTGMVEGTGSNEYSERISLCNACENLTKDRKCSVCKCFVDQKAKIKSQSCALKKW